MVKRLNRVRIQTGNQFATLSYQSAYADLRRWTYLAYGVGALIFGFCVWLLA
jgi:hypothetical protein